MQQQERGIQYFPIALFASVMGVSGVALSVRLFEQIYDIGNGFSSFLLILATLMFLVNSGFFLYRIIKHPELVKIDFNHPVRMNFFGAITISLLLLGALYYDIQEMLSFIVWFIGAVAHFLLTLAILSKLIWKHEFTLAQFNPAWFIPIVGNIVVPLAGVHHTSALINWIFFSIGILFSIIYYTIFMNRIFFQPAPPIKLVPTFFILLAPPGIGFVSYVKLTGEVDIIAYIMFGFAFYLGMLLLVQLKHFLTIPFFLSWWAYLFPNAAVTNATYHLYAHTNEQWLLWLYHIQLLGLIVLTIYLFIKTFELIMKKRLCVKED